MDNKKEKPENSIDGNETSKSSRDEEQTSDSMNLNDEFQELKDKYVRLIAELEHDKRKNAKEKIELIDSITKKYEKLIEDASNNESFENDMSIAIKLHQREEIEKRFQQIDEDEEFELSENEMKTAITSVERESMKKRFAEIDKEEEKGTVFKLLIKYAIAAVVVGVLIGGAYLKFFNAKLSDENAIVNNDSINNNKPDIANVELPNLVESIESNKSILIDKRGSGFAGNISNYDSINIKINGLSNQIDALTATLKKYGIQNNSELDKSYIMISRKIDSLENILNTYTYDYETKRVVLNFPIANKVKNVISKNPKDLSKFYLNVENNYYLIKATETPFELKLITDKEELEKLKRIEFSNE
jgi:hypothetical protein